VAAAAARAEVQQLMRGRPIIVKTDCSLADYLLDRIGSLLDHVLTQHGSPRGDP
jgi:hypothetical protein